MNWSGCELVEIVPGKVSGVPVIRGTRVPADQVIASLDAGETVEEIAYNFDLELVVVRALRAFHEGDRAA